MESPDILYYVSSSTALVILIGLYLFGVWSRSYVMPIPSELPWRKQLVAAIPVGLLTMGAYAKSALPALTQSHANIPFDAAVHPFSALPGCTAQFPPQRENAHETFGREAPSLLRWQPTMAVLTGSVQT